MSTELIEKLALTHNAICFDYDADLQHSTSYEFNYDDLIAFAKAFIEANSETYAEATQKDADKTLTKSHNWDKSGERCLDCGDKDWMQSPVCSGSKLRDK